MGKSITKSKEILESVSEPILRTTKYDSDTDRMIMEVQGTLLAKDNKRVGINKVVNDLIREGYKALKKTKVLI